MKSKQKVVKMLDERSKIANNQYSVLSKYIDYFKETDDDLKITSDLLGMTALNRFITHNTSPRGSMMHGHIGSSVVLVNPSKKIIQSDVDKEFADTAMLKRFENDVIVLSVIQRYRNGTISDNIKPVEYVIVYRDTVTDEINAMSIPSFNRYHIYFGFMYNIDREYIESLIVDDLIPAGKVLAWPNSYDPKTGMYGPGRSLNVALMSEDLTSEDGIIISKSTQIALKHTIIENRRGSGGNETMFLNVHGDENNYKPIVGIGEKIGDRSIAFATRTIDPKTAPSMMSKKNVCKINPIFDKATYVSSPDGVVSDIKVIFNKKRKKKLLKGTSELLDRYKDAYIKYCKDLITAYDSIQKSYKFSTGLDLIVGYEYNTMLVQAYNIVFSTSDNSKIKKMYRKETLDLYNINMDIRQDLLCGIKNKVTSMNGDKGVCVSVWEDENMPIDADGNRADIIMDPGSTISRLNIGRLYERYIGASSRKAKKYVIDNIGDAIINNDIDIILSVFKKYVVDYVVIFDNEQFAVYNKAYLNKDIENIKEVLIEIINEELYVYSNLEDDLKLFELVLLIEQTIFKPPYGTVTYKKDGITHYTKNNIMIAPMYILLLNKLADSLLTTSSAKVNHWGLPIGVSKADKNRFPHKNSPLRSIGETESRIYGSYGGRKFLAELLDRGASTDTHSLIYRNILGHKTPANIKELVNRKEHPYGSHKALEVINTLFQSVGLKIKYTKDKNRYVKPVLKIDNVVFDIDKAEIIADEEIKEEN